MENKNKINFIVESFSIKEKKGKEGVFITGLALPFEKTSRNGIMYSKESVTKTGKTLEGKPMFFNHNIEGLPIGKVEKVNIKKDGLYYEARLIPTTEEEKAIVEKVKAGLLQNVSIQCIYENPEYNKELDIFKVDVKEFLELSVVGVPGFADTTAMVVEKLKENQEIMKLKKKLKEELQEDDNEDDKDINKETDEDEEETEDYITRAEFEDLVNKVTILESKLDALLEEEEEESKEEEEEPNEEEDEKKEEGVAGEPMGKYKDFDDCVKKNQDKDDPEAYCGAIMKKVEDESINRVTAPPIENKKIDIREFKLMRYKNY